MWKKAVFVPCLVAILLIFGSTFCGCSGKTVANGSEFKTEQDAITSRFPKIGDFTACYWKADAIGDSRLSIGPTPYWMKGFVVLGKDNFEDLKKDFQWVRVDDSWNPSLDVSVLKENSFQWAICKAFDSYVMSSDYVGNFYLDFENGILFFDVQQ